MKQTFYDAEIVKIIDETNTTKRFFFKVNHLNQFEFKAGQFVMIDLPIDSKITYRSYSIASAPDGTNEFELLIVLNPDGKGTPYLWENIVVGSIVKVAGPVGKFTLPEELDREVCFLCTGTGIAPLRSMLHDIMNKNKLHYPVKIIFGSRKKEDLLYYEEMAQLAEQYSQFEFIPVLSRETSDVWSGKTGYVHEVYEYIYADKRPCYFYICGWSAMIKEARERLVTLGYTKSDIKFELYD
ncbi:MAG: FAD-binding oxidoreductase [Bacteroidota bacterium]